jgi:hypothetical protein
MYVEQGSEEARILWPDELKVTVNNAAKLSREGKANPEKPLYNYLQ